MNIILHHMGQIRTGIMYQSEVIPIRVRQRSYTFSSVVDEHAMLDPG